MADINGRHKAFKIVGCAILPKKAAKHLHANLLAAAEQHGIHIKQIDLNEPLDKQGPFDLVLHKVRNNPGFEQQLQEYATAHPGTLVLDNMDAIRPLLNRATMLNPVKGEGFMVQAPALRSTLDPEAVQCRAPRQTILPQGTTLAAAEQHLAESNMSFPLVVKTMYSDGTKFCHALGVVYNTQGLQQLLGGAAAAEGLVPPLLCQQYVQHGGRLFKVYVLGKRVVMVKRDSLDIPDGQTTAEDGSGLQLLERISAYPSHQWGHLDTTTQGSCHVPDPPAWLVEGIASQLRQRLHMHMFNFDLICPLRAAARQHPLVFVLDINYWPGFEKLPGYEELMVDFLRCQLGLKEASPSPRHSFSA